jgi:N-acetylmuramoyl-L-alanine amidase
LEDYVPNRWRDFKNIDSSRLFKAYTGIPLVTRNDRPVFSSGLSGCHLAIWPSHGCYYNQAADRWQWQRARLWGTVEDIFPWTLTTQYLVPMLENAGANVLMPRERDPQAHEVVVDNDRVIGASKLLIRNGSRVWIDHAYRGYVKADTLQNEPQFLKGTVLSRWHLPGDTASLIYIPDIPEEGEYAVYISYAMTDSSVTDAHYEVKYTGGLVKIAVNQTMGGSTWIYLGTFHFARGLNPSTGSVTVRGGDSKGMLTSDAIRFGGGMGNVARNGQLSGRPRWMEAARYYLQFAGIPDTLVYGMGKGNDYVDDYISRGAWVNYLSGRAGKENNEEPSGLNIPVDMALALHTDAGTTGNDSVIGTLGIYSATRTGGLFPGGVSRMAGRDLTDLIQSQVVDDTRKLANPNWMHRALLDKEYAEAWRPAVPAALLELLSHQNLADMQCGLDPRFRFVMSRAIYKGILQYMAGVYGREAVVQPLPPDHMAIEATGNRRIRLSWRPVTDSLEQTAIPEGYIIYMQIEENGFEPGLAVKDTVALITLPSWGGLYSFRVTAFNRGGESLPGETLSVSLLPDASPVLIVNAFDRVCAPAFFDKGDLAGIAWWEDEGVTGGVDYGHTGTPYDLYRKSEWLHDDSPGWGASSAEAEGWPLYGNTLDFVRIHGRALRNAGYAFVSVSDEVFASSSYPVEKYPAVDVLFGEERGTTALYDPKAVDFRVFTHGLMSALRRHTQNGGHILLSGAYIGTDMIVAGDSLAIQFTADVLHYKWRTNHATTLGSIRVTGEATGLFPGTLEFNTEGRARIYRVESPDGIEPEGAGAFRIYRYTSGGCTAGVACRGNYNTIILGFPFETIVEETMRTEMMAKTMQFFGLKPSIPYNLKITADDLDPKF